MIDDFKKLAEFMLAAGGETQPWLLKDGTNVKTLDAFVRRSIASREAREFWIQNSTAVVKDSVTFFLRTIPRRPDEFTFRDDIWLICDASYRLQMDAIEKFATDGSSRYNEILFDQKQVLTKVAESCEFRVTSICLGFVIVKSKIKLKKPILDNFFDEIIWFLRKYDRLEMKEKTLQKMITTSGEILL
jgi:hypothetical protein